MLTFHRIYHQVCRMLLVGLLCLTAACAQPSGIKTLPSSASSEPLPVVAPSPSQTPDAVVANLKQTLSQQVGIPATELNLAEATATTWPNGCLGLAKPDELCSQMMIRGWRVVLTQGDRRWVYRTDSTGRVKRLEPQ
jgi:hypothetical protein